MGAYSGVHQFCRVGAHAMIAAGAIVLQDVPPFVTAAGYPATPRGINTEGLRRRGFARRRHPRGPARLQDALSRRALARRRHGRRSAAAAGTSPPLLAPLVEFLAVPGRGIIRALARVADGASRSGGVTIGIVAGEASGDALARDADPRRARAPAARAIRRHRRPADGGGRLRGVVSARDARPCAGSSRCSRACRSSSRCVARSAGASSPSACRCSSASTRRTSISASRAKLKRAGVRSDAFRQPVGLGVAPRAAAHDRPVGAPDARAVSVRAAALRSGRHSRDLRRPSARGGCGARWARGAKRASS